MPKQGLFSKRHGYVRAKEIAYRDELPRKLREPIIGILLRSFNPAFLWDRIEKLFNPYGIDDWPQSDGKPISVAKEEDDPVIVAVKRILLHCEWFRIYDLIEDLFERLDFHDTELRGPEEEFQAFPFQQEINKYFEYAGIGWKLVDGEIKTRGDDAFERTVETAEAEKAGGRTTAADCIEDAIRNLSFRRKPRLGAAVARATTAMECVLHDITGEKKMTFGDYLPRYPNLFPGGLAKTFGGL